ncbi:Six-hairpin glycosidase [Aspergillus heterothallicus]
MSGAIFDRTWMWHPDFYDDRTDTAGLLVHFKRTIHIATPLPASLPIQVSADTRYKLFINQQLIAFGPVKGDQNLWFYDEVDIAPYLKPGDNHIAVTVLRFFYATQYAPTFPRLSSGGLRVVAPDAWAEDLQSSADWKAAIDPRTVFRVDEPEDRFLHVYEKVSLRIGELEWKPAKVLEFRVSTGNSTPWHLSPRLIPKLRVERTAFSAIHNCHSIISPELWERTLLSRDNLDGNLPLCLPAGTTHSLDLKAPFHTTAFVQAIFERPPEDATGSTLTLTYAESYEDEPVEAPDIRRKGHRCDHTKELHGPKDIYELGTMNINDTFLYNPRPESTLIVQPFHWRTFRFIRLEITVGSHPLVLNELRIDKVNYPLDVFASIDADDVETQKMWDISVRTLENCMHDCYEDCPFYEQLQYAMDVRSSALFTYYLSGDDRMARQAIIQLRNSFQARIGLTLSRSPTHRPQIIPHFSLFWVLIVFDHFRFFGDILFTKQSVPIIEAILSFFENKIEPTLGLVKLEDGPGIWNFTDWVPEWKPHGVNAAAKETGISTYTNNLYAYTLTCVSSMMTTLGLPHRAKSYHTQAESLAHGIRKHCFNGTFFTDTLTSASNNPQLSQHAQVWSVLSGAATGDLAQTILRKSLSANTQQPFIKVSTAMSFYTARALSKVGGSVYDEHFHRFWNPWRAQMDMGLTTWQEDDVSRRSDCHAWGSVPIYELTAEVMGLSPAVPGWGVVRFAPRVALYRRFRGTVPIPTRVASGAVEVGLSFAWADARDDTHQPLMSVLVELPQLDIARMDKASRLTFTIDPNGSHHFSVRDG